MGKGPVPYSEVCESKACVVAGQVVEGRSERKKVAFF